jgi:hypothetical protein
MRAALGDSVLEELFAWLCTLTHQMNFDMLELAQVQAVYERQPQWHRQGIRMSVRDDIDCSYAVKASSMVGGCAFKGGVG